MDDVLRTTALALGASLIGACLPMAILSSPITTLFILCLGVIFTLYGTGFLQEHIIQPCLRFYRKRRMVIGVISDLPFHGQGHAPSDMPPEKWVDYLKRKLPAKLHVRTLKISNFFTQLCIDRYNAIINPYGSIYPEIDMQNLPILKRILHYVEHGGLFLNIADLPFFFVCDVKTYTMQTTARIDTAHYYKRIAHILKQREARIYSSPLSGYDYIFSKLLSLEFLATEIYKKTRKGQMWHKYPLETDIKLQNKDIKIACVKMHRGIVWGEKVEILTEKMLWSVIGEMRKAIVITPLCFIHHGNGLFLTCLLWLDQQNDETRKIIIDVLCDLMLEKLLAQSHIKRA